MSISRIILGVLGIVALIYGAYGVLAVQGYRPLLYPFYDQSPFDSAGFARVEVAGPDGPVVAYVNEAAPDAPIVVYFMGNVGALKAFAPMLEHHAAAGRRVVAMGYRGGGGVPGAPSEVALKADALALIDGLSAVTGGARGPVIVQGYSLGTGLALHVAAEREVDGLILAAPYARICELMTAYSYLPACFLPGIDKWQSIRDARRVSEPAIVLHGQEDALIPFRHGARIVEAMQEAGAAAELVAIPLGGHADLFGKPPYLEAMDGFVGGIAAGFVAAE